MAFRRGPSERGDGSFTDAFFGRHLGRGRTPRSFSPGSLCRPVSYLSLAPFKETLPGRISPHTAKTLDELFCLSFDRGRQCVAEIKLLDLSPYLRKRFRSLMEEFREHDQKLYLRNFRGSSLFALATTITFFIVFFRVITNVLKGSLTVGDVAMFGGATARLRFSLEGTIRALSSALEQTLYISNLIKSFKEKPQMRSGSATLASPCRGDQSEKCIVYLSGLQQACLARYFTAHRAGDSILQGESNKDMTPIRAHYETGSRQLGVCLGPAPVVQVSLAPCCGDTSKAR